MAIEHDARSATRNHNDESGIGSYTEAKANRRRARQQKQSADSGHPLCRRHCNPDRRFRHSTGQVGGHGMLPRLHDGSGSRQQLLSCSTAGDENQSIGRPIQRGGGLLLVPGRPEQVVIKGVGFGRHLRIERTQGLLTARHRRGIRHPSTPRRAHATRLRQSQ